VTRRRAGDADDDAAIGDVKERPDVLPDVSFDKVDHVALAQAVDQVAQRAAEDHPHADAQEQHVAWEVAHERHHDPRDDDGDEQRQDPLLVEEAKGNAGVAHVDKGQKRA